MQALMGVDPVPGTWSDGAETSVVTTFGEPTHACVRRGWTEFRLPVVLTSDDDRLHFSQVTEAGLSYSEGNLSLVHAQSYQTRSIPREVFDTQTGISGVDFGDLAGGTWSMALEVGDPAAKTWYEGDSPAQGNLSVSGVTRDGVVEPDPLATFEWSR